ncbi:MAG: hypothetical protein O9256_04380 [Rhizobiaceae bacterium]|nr:hypothetical protein [Rhizobiaceae bacterium]MCZ8352973.1 hypothetical protein [Rhizobium sp.]
MQIISGLVTFAAEDNDSVTPEWIKVAPRGRFTARDGRSFEVSPEALTERFNADGISIPVDLNHSTILKATKGDESPAYGWIEELQARSDGLYGRVKWLDRGRSVLAEKSHPYLSPAFGSTDSKGRATWLHSVALVATPAVAMPALASAQTNEEETTAMANKKIAQALGLSADVSEDDLLSAIANLRAKADATTALIDGAQSAMKTLSAEVGKTRNDRIERRIDDAIRAGTATPALRDFCVTLATLDEGMFDQFCAKMGTPFAYLSQSAISAERELQVLEQNRDRPVTLSTDAQRLAAQLGIDAKALL